MLYCIGFALREVVHTFCFAKGAGRTKQGERKKKGGVVAVDWFRVLEWIGDIPFCSIIFYYFALNIFSSRIKLCSWMIWRGK